MKKWIKTIAEYIAQREGLSVDDIFTVWSCKTLQNRKAIFGCTRDQQLWEATYNGRRNLHRPLSEVQQLGFEGGSQ